MKENVIYKVLRLNLFIAIIAMLIGGVCHFLEYNNSISNEIMNTGLLLLIISPVLRICLELVFFVKEQNYTYIIICLALFIIIAISIIS
ncbi:hypothetical protein LO80_01160 [Candidatus Francisella endociliophora]|uniref:DUF1634 domain-containing protein n=2 Tax=Candidatus Francisella endociliophora TaxID=653937 RepID=A0A097EME3_9GAMM|nr:DUF1634 domain-containing protein [Francisella sp. FSC1006]AIT08718.1 hypothetical protein LO80_01160 [Francisella sp. FSC1006]